MYKLKDVTFSKIADFFFHLHHVIKKNLEGVGSYDLVKVLVLISTTT